jgi:hypothetical protein
MNARVNFAFWRRKMPKEKACTRIHDVELFVGLWGDAYDAVFVYLNPSSGAFQDITLHPIIRWKQNAFIALNVQ